MARVYSVGGGGLTLANQAVTLVFINPSATIGIDVKRCWAGQTGTATSAQQRVQTNTQPTAFPTLVSATPSKLNFSDPVSGIAGATTGAAGTSGINASAEGAGTKANIISDTFNNLNGYLWVATPDEVIRINAGASSGFGLHLPVAPGSLSNWQCGANFAEL